MGQELVERIARELLQGSSDRVRGVLRAVGRGGEVVRWPATGRGGPPAADIWMLDAPSVPDGQLRYRRVDAELVQLERQELVQLLDAPEPTASRPWAATSLGRAVLAELDRALGVSGDAVVG